MHIFQQNSKQNVKDTMEIETNVFHDSESVCPSTSVDVNVVNPTRKRSRVRLLPKHLKEADLTPRDMQQGGLIKVDAIIEDAYEISALRVSGAVIFIAGWMTRRLLANAYICILKSVKLVKKLY